jgi:FkbM family methyltransferase
MGLYGWEWSKFSGGKDCLRWNARDLQENLDPVLATMQTDGRPMRNVIQAGGNLGLFPKRLAQVFDFVYTFEPDSQNFVSMCRNAPEEKIYKFCAALGEKRGLVGISRERRDGKPNNHEGIRHVAGTGSVPVFQIDDLGLEECDLIQLDLEGYELYALNGAFRTIKKCKPILMVEINKSLKFMGLAEDDVRTALRVHHNYEFHSRINSDEIWLPRQ